MTVGDFERCKICKEWGWFGGTHSNHICKPPWEVRGEWQDANDWRTIHAIDAETAAEKFADEYDSEGGEYAIVQGHGDYFVLTRKPKDPDAETDLPFERWSVEGESVPQYSATKVDADD